MKKNLHCFILSAVLGTACIGANLPFTAPSASSFTASAAEYSSFVKTEPDERCKLYGAPSAILRLKDEDALNEIDLSTDERPASVIMTLNEDMNVLSADGGVIGSFDDVFSQIYLAAIPIAEIKTQSAAEAFVSAYESNKIADLTVLSADDSILSYVRNALPSIRGIYDCTKKSLTDKTEIIKTSTAAMASTIILSEEQSDLATVTYFQRRMKTVWTELPDDADSFDVKNAVSSGTYGLIKNDCSEIFKAYASYKGGSLNTGSKYVQPSVARYSLNIAHRGLPITKAENTIEGCKAAVASGATHLEIDAQLSKDNKIVIMHDSSIARTTDYETGEHEISNMTLEEIRRYKVCKTMNGYKTDPCEIPTAENFFKEFKGKDVVFVFEIKSAAPALITELRTLIEKYDFWDQITVISFNSSVLAQMHSVIPEVPIASLAGFAQKNFETDSALYNSFNAVADITQGNLNDFVYFESTLKDRGYMSFCWTIGSAQDCISLSANGEFALTNNVADSYGNAVCKIEGKSGQKAEETNLKTGEKITIVSTAYNGETEEQEGTIFAIRKFGDHAEIIAAYEEVEKVTYTRAFRVDYTTRETKKGGCKSAVGGSMLAALVIASAIAFTSKKETM